MGKGRVDLSKIRFFILDEADRMLDMGFRPQIQDIQKGLRGKPQIMLFSATMYDQARGSEINVLEVPDQLTDSPRAEGTHPGSVQSEPKQTVGPS
jgi:superfamily II DNA/RNA helicase